MNNGKSLRRPRCWNRIIIIKQEKQMCAPCLPLDLKHLTEIVQVTSAYMPLRWILIFSQIQWIRNWVRRSKTKEALFILCWYYWGNTNMCIASVFMNQHKNIHCCWTSFKQTTYIQISFNAYGIIRLTGCNGCVQIKLIAKFITSAHRHIFFFEE